MDMQKSKKLLWAENQSTSWFDEDEDVDWLSPLPPPAAELSEASGPFPAEVWSHTLLFLDPCSLCRTEQAASCCRLSKSLETEVWSSLCAVHFPTMHSSVLSARAEMACTEKSPQAQQAPRSSQKMKGRENRKKTTSGSDRTCSRTPWWRQQDLPITLDFSLSDVLDDLDDPDIIYEHILASESFSSTSASQAETTVPSSPDSLVAEFSPPTSPDLLLEGSNIVGCQSVPWRELFAKRFQKKLQWDATKKRRERAFSINSEASDSAPGSTHVSPFLRAQPEPTRRISELTRREVGKLTESTHRLKICTFCGEKFSPGEARTEPTSCCFHPGDFGPLSLSGWSGPELKQLRQFARQALRNAGGSSWVERHPRASRGRGHWLKGLGVLAKGKEKFLRCLTGEDAAAWSCCESKGLFESGCQHGMHRHF